MRLYHECWLLGHIDNNKNGKYNKPSSQTNRTQKTEQRRMIEIVQVH